MHWYHHAITGYFALANWKSDNAYLIYGVMANYFVHFLMYTYYCLRSFRVKVPPQVAQFITTSQMVQFLIVIAAMFDAQIRMSAGQKVAATAWGLFIGQWTMWSFMFLWLRFYYISYYGSGGKKYVRHQEEKSTTAKAQ